MRKFFALTALLLPFVACKTGSSKNHVEDKQNLYYAPPPPEHLTEAELAAFQNKLSLLFDSGLFSTNFNGSVLVAKGGNILYEKYSGFRNPRDTSAHITDTTAFHLASTSKPFTGMAVLRLVQQGKIGLDDDVIKYFPGFPYSGITVKMLLSHRSGLPNYLYFMEDKQKWPADKKVNNPDVLNFIMKYQPELSYKPGTHFSYCNTNFVLLALIIEKVTGKNYPQYMRENIFKPLGMEHSFVYTPDMNDKVILSYKPSGRVWDDDIFDNTYGDKNIYSTPRDLLKWDAALYNEKFISKSLLDSAYTPLSTERPSIHNYGLAWRMLNLPNGKKVIYHNGKWHGFNPAFARLTDEKAVIIILGNQYNRNIYTVAKKCYNVFGDYMQATASEEGDESPLVTRGDKGNKDTASHGQSHKALQQKQHSKK